MLGYSIELNLDKNETSSCVSLRFLQREKDGNHEGWGIIVCNRKYRYISAKLHGVACQRTSSSDVFLFSLNPTAKITHD